MKEVIWHGDSLDVVREWPKAVRRNVGFELDSIQNGKSPTPGNVKSMSDVGRGVKEIRILQGGWYRVLYVDTRDDGIHVLTAYEKKSNRAPKSVIKTAKQRLKEI